MNRVLIVSEHFPPSTVGGTATYAYNLSRYLVKVGWEVYLITQPSYGEAKARWYIQEGVNIYRLNIPDIFTKKLLFPRAFSIYLHKQIRRIITELCPDIVHFASGWYPLIVTRFCAELTRIPIVWTVHNVPPAEHYLRIFKSDEINEPFERIYYKLLECFSSFQLKLYKYDRIISVSNATANKLVIKGILRDKVSVIPNGVDIHYYTNTTKKEPEQSNSEFVVLTVGRIIQHKGQINIIKCAPEVVARFPQVRFIFVGPIASEHYFDVLKKTIRELGLEQNIKITRDVSQKELLLYYQLCDLYLQPSLEEGFCITMIEAMACGKPIIGTPVGEIATLITESKAGILISCPLPTEISNAIIQLLADEKLRKELGKRAREYVVANYSWAAVARQTANQYCRILREKI